jgi:microcystin-dependent protein
MRGLVAAGLDQMPGGARANRVTRSVAIAIAGSAGEEVHVITVPELAAHSHAITDPGHAHTSKVFSSGSGVTPTPNRSSGTQTATPDINPNTTGITIQNAGSNNAHENMQPTVFVPYMVKLDD